MSLHLFEQLACVGTSRLHHVDSQVIDASCSASHIFYVGGFKSIRVLSRQLLDCLFECVARRFFVSVDRSLPTLRLGFHSYLIPFKVFYHLNEVVEHTSEIFVQGDSDGVFKRHLDHVKVSIVHESVADLCAYALL